jgi:hypothetical protein
VIALAGSGIAEPVTCPPTGGQVPSGVATNLIDRLSPANPLQFGDAIGVESTGMLPHPGSPSVVIVDFPAVQAPSV